MNWEHLSYLLQSPLSQKVLEELSKHDFITPTQLGKNINVAGSNVSAKLTELQKRGLVECMNPQNHKWRFYKITSKGKETLSQLRKMPKREDSQK